MTECLAITDDSLAAGAALLAAGQLVAFPTETVYGLGADACDANAVAAIFAAKKRPSFNPLISHIASAEAGFSLGVETDLASALAAAFWPGPLTLILKRTPDCPIAMLTSAGLDKIALRVPAHAGAQQLLTAFGGPVAAPSANPSGRISPTLAAHVMALMDGEVSLILDGGPCLSGVESTVVDCTGDAAVLLRPGGITRDQLSTALQDAGLPDQILTAPPIGAGQSPTSPGQLESHYAPRNPVRLNAATPRDGEILIGFGDHNSGTLNLSHTGDLTEAAANLFDLLHKADAKVSAATNLAGIAIAPIPKAGLGEAINDRLRRATVSR